MIDHLDTTETTIYKIIGPETEITADIDVTTVDIQATLVMMTTTNYPRMHRDVIYMTAMHRHRTGNGDRCSDPTDSTDLVTSTPTYENLRTVPPTIDGTALINAPFSKHH